MAQRPMFFAAMVETLFDVTKPDSSMQNPAAIHITRKPITKNRKEFRIQAVSSETSALATDVKNKTLMKVKLIVAYCKNRGIGFQNQLPWRLSADLKRFKELTIGNGNNAVIMGRNTWASLPSEYKPLPKRENIVFI